MPSSRTSPIGPEAMDPPVAQEQGVRHARRDVIHVVRDEHERRRRRVRGEIGERRDELFSTGEIESGRRLVEQHQGGIRHQRPSQQDPLALT